MSKRFKSIDHDTMDITWDDGSVDPIDVWCGKAGAVAMAAKFANRQRELGKRAQDIYYAGKLAIFNDRDSDLRKAVGTERYEDPTGLERYLMANDKEFLALCDEQAKWCDVLTGIGRITQQFSPEETA